MPQTVSMWARQELYRRHALEGHQLSKQIIKTLTGDNIPQRAFSFATTKLCMRYRSEYNTIRDQRKKDLLNA